MPSNNTIVIRKGSASQWNSSNPTLSNGEPGFEYDTGRFKIGDGTTAWNSLNYSAIVPTGIIPGTGISLSFGSNASTLTINSTASSSSSNIVLSDFVTNTNYIGIAAQGSLTSQSVWKIKKTIYSSDGSVSANSTATNVKWDDRLTATYT